MQDAPVLCCGQEVGLPNPLIHSSRCPIHWSANYDRKNSYRKILIFYNASLAVRRGILYPFNDNDMITFTKTYLNDTVPVMVNCRNTSVQDTLPATLANTFPTNTLNNAPLSPGTVLTLQPYRFYILRKNSLTFQWILK